MEECTPELSCVSKEVLIFSPECFFFRSASTLAFFDNLSTYQHLHLLHMMGDCFPGITTCKPLVSADYNRIHRKTSHLRAYNQDLS